MLALLHAAQAAPRSRSVLKPPRKLAFLRARAHSQTRAQVPYRGRLHEASALGTTRCKETTPAPSRKALSSPNKRGIRVVTWIPGGLHSARWAELLQWLQDEAAQHRPVHICLIQETHWTSSTEFIDSSWLYMHSNTGSREGGVLAMINKYSFRDCPVKLAELTPGRFQHIRIGTTPPIDLLNVYQFAWNPAKTELQHQSSSPEQLLLEQRQDVWNKMRSWIASIPKRNSLVIAGDFNASLEILHPYVGPGTGPVHWHKKDNSVIQAIIQTSGLNAVNTWRKAGRQASAFCTQKGEGSQIDYILLRNPCNPSRLNACTLPHSPIIHPTDFRHILVQYTIPWPTIPKQSQISNLIAASVRRTCARQPAVLERFCQEVADLNCTAEELDQPLLAKRQMGQHSAPRLPIVQLPSQESNLKSYWESKRHLRMLADTTMPPCILSVHEVGALHRHERLNCKGRFLQAVLQRWQAAAVFQIQNIALRKRTRDRKREKPESQIAEATEADRKGLTHLYKYMNTLRPKHPKRSIHITGPEGRLQSDQTEIANVWEYFQGIFSSSSPKLQATWHLQGALNFSKEEIRSALRRLSAKKAFPSGHAPALLWQSGESTVVSIIHQDWSTRFQTG